MNWTSRSLPGKDRPLAGTQVTSRPRFRAPHASPCPLPAWRAWQGPVLLGGDTASWRSLQGPLRQLQALDLSGAVGTRVLVLSFFGT